MPLFSATFIFHSFTHLAGPRHKLFRKRGLPALNQPKGRHHSTFEARCSSNPLSIMRPNCFFATLTPSPSTEANGDRKLETSGAHRFQLLCTTDLQSSENPEVSRTHLTATFNHLFFFHFIQSFQRKLKSQSRDERHLEFLEHTGED